MNVLDSSSLDLRPSIVSLPLTAKIFPILIAIGVIICLGSIGLSSYLFHDLGWKVLVIGGGGVVCGTICILFALHLSQNSNNISKLENVYETQPILLNKNNLAFTSMNEKLEDESVFESKSKVNNLKFNRLPCAHKNNSCFVNAALQIVAHLINLRRLFDENQYKLEKKPQQTDNIFRQRQIVQQQGKKLIDLILEGKRVNELEVFMQAINNATRSMQIMTGDGITPYQFDIQKGGDVENLINCLLDILLNKKLDEETYYCDNIDIANSDLIKESIENEEENKNVVISCIRFKDPTDPIPYYPQIIIENIGTYRLEAVVLGGTGHSVPIIRSEEGTFYMLDDLSEKPREVSETELSNILAAKRGWMLYYGKIN